MDNFTLIKLKRAIWTAYLEQQNISDAVKHYKSYIESLKKHKSLKEEIKKELEYSKKFFQSKLIELGEKLLKDKNFSSALIAFDTAFNNDNQDEKCLKGYISCLQELKQYDLSTSMLKYLEEISKDKDIYKYLAQSCEKQESFAQSVEYMEKYMDKKGRDKAGADDFNILGCLYNKYYSEQSHKRIDIEKGLAAFEKASDMVPTLRLYAKNATIMAGKGNFNTQGRKYWDRLLKIDKMTNDDKYDYAAFCLRTGNFSEWHKYFDARFDKENNATIFPKINKPLWDGVKDISNSTLLVHCEQGFGDTFLMWGYMPRILKLAKKIIFIAQDDAYDLLKNNEYGIQVYSKKDADLNKLAFDFYIPSMSIPIALKFDRSNISVGEGYIKPDNELVESIKQKYFNNNNLKIGISFSGNKNGNRTRDIATKEFLPLENIENVSIYNLTKDLKDEDFEIFKKNKVINIAKNFTNFADTAAAIKNCDAVLTADNCILNLSGAVGVPTFALFNWTYEFRWFDLTGDNVVWYTCVKPYKCDDIDNWQSAVIPAIEDIKALRK